MFPISKKVEWDSAANAVLAGALILTLVLLILAKPSSWFAAGAGLTASLAWLTPRIAVVRRTS